MAVLRITSSHLKPRINTRVQSLPPISSYYRPQRSWGKVIFLQASVILAKGEGGACFRGVCSGGVCAWSWGGLLPGGCLLLGGRLLPGGCLVEPPPPGRPLLRVVRILLECILVSEVICTFNSDDSNGSNHHF